ncbi:hypothetical protein [Glycomyces xiaoerkulensis]|uniref:hypothetical protein n=1 Tax=Glycomyces xiaoerkulensis TaxID=2038139 RepID=UPI0012FFFB54|nr:hypothetical protein [Glycomyces xiaoerkulensis]
MNFPPAPGEQPAAPYGQPQQPPPLPYPAPPSSSSGVRLAAGLPLLIVPVVALVIAYLLPTIRTISHSMRSGAPFFGDSESVGLDNYELVLGDLPFLDGFLVLLRPVLATVIAGAVIAPLVAWCLHHAGAATRLASRIVWGIAAVLFAPAAMTLAWYVSVIQDHTGEGAPWEDASLLDWASLMTGVVLATGILVALAAFRGGTDTGKQAATVLTAAGLTAITLVAAGLQTFTFPYFTALPVDSEPPPLVQIFDSGFRLLEYGIGTAMSTVLLAVLAVLGIGAALLFILTRTRVDVSPGPGEPRRFHLGAGPAGILLLVLFAAGVVISLWPWLTRLTNESTVEGVDGTEVALDTWLPALMTTGIALTTSVVGGFAIGAFRPLGGGSRWLLLLFAPWLFVGSGPLVLAAYQSLADADDIGSYGSLLPRAWIAIPALFVFTALFWGLEDRRQAMVAAGARPGKAAGAFATGALPMVALVGMFIWLVNAQDTVWQVGVAGVEQNSASMTMLYEFQSAFATTDIGVGIGYPIVLLALFAAAMVVAAVFYLPRVGIRIGR